MGTPGLGYDRWVMLIFFVLLGYGNVCFGAFKQWRALEPRNSHARDRRSHLMFCRLNSRRFILMDNYAPQPPGNQQSGAEKRKEKDENNARMSLSGKLHS